MKDIYRVIRRGLTISTAAMICVLTGVNPVCASENLYRLNIPAAGASAALDRLAEETGHSLFYPTDDLTSVTTNALDGSYTLPGALDILLKGTRLNAVVTEKGVIVISTAPDTQRNNSDEGRAMKESQKKLSVLAGIASFLAAMVTAPNVAGQETRESGAQKSAIEEVVVTATKTGEMNLQDTPIAITAISSDLLAATNSRSLMDLAKLLPNTEIEYYGPGRMIGYVRGVGSQLTQNTGEQNVGFYLDGVYLDKGYGSWTSYFDLERIEVLRGPQGTLYGRNSTAGAVNLISSPATDELALKLGVELGSEDQKRVDAMISGPIIKDKVKARASFSRTSHDGYLHNLVGADLYEEDYTGARGSLELAPTAWVDIQLRADYYNSESRTLRNRLVRSGGMGSTRALAAGFPLSTLLPSDFWTTAQDGDVSNDLRNWGVSGKAEFKLPHNQFLRSTTSYRKTLFSYGMDFDSVPLKLAEAGADPQQFDTFTQEFQLDGSSDRWKWIVGLFYLHGEEKATYPSAYDFLMPGLLNVVNTKFGTDAWGVFGNVNYEVTDRLTAEVGVRYSNEEKKVFYNNSVFIPPIAPATSDAPDSKSWDSISPRFGVNYRLSEDALLFASVSNGFKSGLYAPRNPAGEKWIDPESLWDYEIGIKTEWLDHRLRVNVGAFYYDYTDLQQQTLTIQGNTIRVQFTNAAKATINGVELELTARPISTLTLSSAISYLDATFADFLTVTAGQRKDLSGNSLPFAPEWKFAFGAQYVIRLGDYGSLTFRGDVNWTDKAYFTYFNDERLKQDAYTLLNGLVRFEPSGGHWSVEAFVKNLGEKEYAVSGQEFIGDYMVFVGEPRIFGLKAIYQF